MANDVATLLNGDNFCLVGVEEAATKTEDGMTLLMAMTVMKMSNYRRQKQNRHDMTKSAAGEEKKATANRGRCKNCGWYIHTFVNSLLLGSFLSNSLLFQHRQR